MPDRISATLIALPTMKTSHPTPEVSAPTLCSRVVRVQKVVRTPAFPVTLKPTAVASQVTVAESVTLRVQVISKFLTKAEWGRVHFKPRDTIRGMIAKLQGCVGDDIIDTLDFRKLDFAWSSFFSRVKKGCVSALVSKSCHCGLFVKEFENKGSVHWLREGDEEPREEFFKRACQQAADEGTPGLAFSASCSLGIRRPAGMAPSTNTAVFVAAP